MELGDYQNLKEDTEKYMKDFISKYNLKVSQKYPIDIEPEVFLENDKFFIRLATAETFPYSDVIFKIFIKNDEHSRKLNEDEILKKFNLTDKEYTKQWLNINNSIPYPSDSEFSHYHQALLRIKKILEMYYIPLIYDNSV